MTTEKNVIELWRKKEIAARLSHASDAEKRLEQWLGEIKSLSLLFEAVDNRFTER